MATTKRIIVRQITCEYQLPGGAALTVNALKEVAGDAGEVTRQPESWTFQQAGAAAIADGCFADLKAALEARFPGWTVEKFVPPEDAL